MSWWESADAALFRFINVKLSHPVLDTIMPLFSSNPFFIPVVLGLAIALLWNGGTRGRVFVLLLALILALGDTFVINTLKHALGRMRPFHNIVDAHLLVGRGSSGSMPSSHTSTWFAALLISYIFYPRTWRFMLPLALVVAFSRVYVGVHYPSDVLMGAVLGAGYGAAGLLALNWLWRTAGARWFPDCWQRMPSLLQPPPKHAMPAVPVRSETWLRLGYVLIGLLAMVRLIYIGTDTIELSEDEAYQWLWSKHLALSYYSKPPMIAYLQFAGTSLWGDTEFGVRFFSPIIAAVLSVLMLRFLSATVDARAGFWMVVLINCTPLLAVGATLMTIDPPLVLFWTAAMIAGWRAIQPTGQTRHWAWTGLWMGLAFLSKYSALFQLVCWALFFCLWAPSRPHLKRPGPWLALLIVAVCTIPVIVWNAQHHWVTVEHVAYNAGRTAPWKPTLRFFFEFLGSELGLLNPIFFGGTIWALAAFWKRWRGDALMIFLFSMGAPVFIGYLLFTFYKRVFPNWIAPAVLPMLCLAVVYWHRRWRESFPLGAPASLPAVRLRGWLVAGVTIGCFAVVLLHDTNLTRKIMGRTLPPAVDPLRRVRGWAETARVVGSVRDELASETPTFIIADHYGLAGELSFYLPPAREALRNSQTLVYYKTAERPKNQFYFWPGYRGHRTGQNAVFVREADLPKLQKDFFLKWLAGEKNLYESVRPKRSRPPAELVNEFESITDLGIVDVRYKGRVLRRLHLFACRNLRA
jgi:4-amino-4-deoxy-L-arabinose transferase-like glycosyltransferase/membrane-associated phospholipid phosphatase